MNSKPLDIDTLHIVKQELKQLINAKRVIVTKLAREGKPELAEIDSDKLMGLWEAFTAVDNLIDQELLAK